MYRMILETQINYSIIHKYFRLSRNICISDGWCTFSFSAQKLTTTTESHLFFFLVKPCHGNDLKLLPYETKNTFVCVCVGLSKRFAYKCSVWIKISTIYNLKIKLKIYYCEISERRFQQNKLISPNHGSYTMLMIDKQMLHCGLMSPSSH